MCLIHQQTMSSTNMWSGWKYQFQTNWETLRSKTCEVYIGERKRWNTKELLNISLYCVNFTHVLCGDYLNKTWHPVQKRALVKEKLLRDEKLVLMSCKNDKMWFLLFFSSPLPPFLIWAAPTRSIGPDGVISLITKIRV